VHITKEKHELSIKGSFAVRYADSPG